MGIINVGWTPTHSCVNPEDGKVPRYDCNGYLLTNTPPSNTLRTKAAVNIDFVNNVINVQNGDLSNLTNSVNSLEYSLIGLAIEVETIKNAEVHGMADNVYIETFLTLDDVTLTEGYYDSVNKKIIA